MPKAKSTTPAPYQDVLVYADATPASKAALTFADVLTGDGNLTCVMFGFLAVYPTSMYMEASPDIWMQAQRKAEAFSQETEEKVRADLAALTHKVELQRQDVLEADSGSVLGTHGRYADAVIIGWPANAGAFERDLFTGVLFKSGGPVVLVPEAHVATSPPRQIMVAWSGTKESASAVRDALPLLKAADEVRVVCVVTSGPQAEQDPGADIARHLARHDVKVHVKQVPAGGRSAGDVLMDEARYMGADLIVMGGYGHSRLAEWIMGGVTRDLLGKLPAPVLFSH